MLCFLTDFIIRYTWPPVFPIEPLPGLFIHKVQAFRFHDIFPCLLLIDYLLKNDTDFVVPEFYSSLFEWLV